VSESTCKYCDAPILWPDATFYIDDDGHWCNKSLPLDPSGWIHNCPALAKKRRPD